LEGCIAQGINTWQSAGPSDLKYYRQHRKKDGKLQYISLATKDAENPCFIDRIVDAGAIAIAHHGEVTDRLFKADKIEMVQDLLDGIRKRGVMAGVSTHMPSVIDYIEREGWDLDFYMTCIYERHRSRDELKSMLDHVPIPIKEVYLEEDPPRMFEAMRQTSKPCLAFKILAAGRICDSQENVEQAFKSTLQQIKPNDALIVGMHTEYGDQVRINAEYVQRFSGLSRGSVSS